MQEASKKIENEGLPSALLGAINKYINGCEQTAANHNREFNPDDAKQLLLRELQEVNQLLLPGLRIDTSNPQNSPMSSAALLLFNNLEQTLRKFSPVPTAIHSLEVLKIALSELKKNLTKSADTNMGNLSWIAIDDRVMLDIARTAILHDLLEDHRHGVQKPAILKKIQNIAGTACVETIKLLTKECDDAGKQEGDREFFNRLIQHTEPYEKMIGVIVKLSDILANLELAKWSRDKQVNKFTDVFVYVNSLCKAMNIVNNNLVSNELMGRSITHPQQYYFTMNALADTAQGLYDAIMAQYDECIKNLTAEELQRLPELAQTKFGELQVLTAAEGAPLTMDVEMIRIVEA